jgi:vitamin K-dependent gamma-carboxylase
MMSEAAKSKTAPLTVSNAGAWHRWCAFLSAPVNGTSLAVFRIWFALCMLANTWAYTIDVHIDYLKPKLFFSFIPGMIMWPGAGIYVHFAILAISAAMIGLGFYYRAATIVFFFAHTYLFLLEKAYYQNHFYLVSLLSFLFMFLPANKVWAVDNEEKGSQNLVPRWSVLILKLQIAIVYFYGGIAKLSTDWLSGHPQTEFLSQFAHEPLIGSIVAHPWFAYLVTYAGITIDLSIGFLLFWAPTFWLGAVVAVAFHLMNSRLFPIGIFPWLMIGTTTLFAPYDWPERLKNKFVSWKSSRKANESKTVESLPDSLSKPVSWNYQISIGMLILLHVYVLIQVVLPWRRFFYPGDTSWTELGHRFSWSMMLRTKLVKSFEVTVTNPKTGEKHLVDYSKDLSPKQVFHMQTRPDMILQYAHYVADVEEKKLGVRPKVSVRAVESLNLRQIQDLIDPTVDLAAEQDSLSAPRWIVPLYPAPSLRMQRRVITNSTHGPAEAP